MIESEKTSPKVINLYDKHFDRIIFLILILILTLMIFLFKDRNLNLTSPIYYLIVKMTINEMHVFFSWFLMLENKKIYEHTKGKITYFGIYILPIFLISFVNLSLFKTLLGYFGLFHILMQFYGLIKISHKIENSPLSSFLGVILFWTITTASLLYWFQGYSYVGLSYYFPRNLFLISPFIQAHVLISILKFSLLTYTIFLILNFIKNNTLNLGQIYVMISISMVYFVGLVLVKSNTLFYLLITSSHGLTYFGHVLYTNKKLHHRFVRDYKNLLWTICASICWTLSIAFLMETPLLITLISLPVYLHFLFDGYFWKKNRFMTYA